MAIDPDLWRRRAGLIPGRASTPDLRGMASAGLGVGPLAVVEGTDLEYGEHILGHPEAKATKRTLQASDSAR